MPYVRRRSTVSHSRYQPRSSRRVTRHVVRRPRRVPVRRSIVRSHRVRGCR